MHKMPGTTQDRSDRTFLGVFHGAKKAPLQRQNSIRGDRAMDVNPADRIEIQSYRTGNTHFSTVMMQ